MRIITNFLWLLLGIIHSNSVFAEKPLTLRESKAIELMGHSETIILTREKVIFVWPKDIPLPSFERHPHYPVKNLEELTSFINDVLYPKLAHYFDFDPQRDSNDPIWASNRLVIGFNRSDEGAWKGSYSSSFRISWGNPLHGVGQRESIGTLVHEMAHYFAGKILRAPGYGEGIPDFFRYQLNLELGWHDLAKTERQRYLNHCYQNSHAKYHGAAGALLYLYENNPFSNAKDFFHSLMNSEFSSAPAPVWMMSQDKSFIMGIEKYCRNKRGQLNNLDPVNLQIFEDFFESQVHAISILEKFFNEAGWRNFDNPANQRFYRYWIPELKKIFENLSDSELKVAVQKIDRQDSFTVDELHFYNHQLHEFKEFLILSYLPLLR